MKKKMLILTVLAVLALYGCTTSTRLLLPPGTDLVIRGESIPADQDGRVDLTVMPFFWTGIDYELTRGGKVIQQGELRSRFRFVSVLWPPVAYIYWPKGFAYNCYDLTAGMAQECPPATPEEKEKRAKREAKIAAKKEARRLAREASLKAAKEKAAAEKKND